MDNLNNYDIRRDDEIWQLIASEKERQKNYINLIASENICPQEILDVQGSILTNKYAEGQPGKRFYGGCEFVDQIEKIAQCRCLEIFNAVHDYKVNVQPHSGTQANIAVYFGVLKQGDCILSMDFGAGGHLSHGHPLSIVSHFFAIETYTVDRYTLLLNYDLILEKAKKVKPKIIIAGASSYSREIDYKKFSEIAKCVGALLMVDCAHIAGLIVAGLHMSPVGYADFITFTTHKTMRGARGGCIIMKNEHEQQINRALMPGIQGGPLVHAIAAKAITFSYAAKKEFKEYQQKVIGNAKLMAAILQKNNIEIISGGTDNHLFVTNTMAYKKTGFEVQEKLEKQKIIVNKNCIPFDTLSPLVTSGIRIGTPFVTAQNITEEKIQEVCEILKKAIKC